jgi:hypothetical protein
MLRVKLAVVGVSSQYCFFLCGFLLSVLSFLVGSAHSAHNINACRADGVCLYVLT